MRFFRKTYLWWFCNKEWVVTKEKMIGRRPIAPGTGCRKIVSVIEMTFFHPEGFRVKRKYYR